MSPSINFEVILYLLKDLGVMLAIIDFFLIKIS